MAKGAGPSAGAAAGAAGRKAMESTGKEAAGGGAASGSSSVRSGAYQGCRGGQIPDGRRLASRATNLASSAGRGDAEKPGLFEGGFEVQTKLETLQSVEKKSSGTTPSPSLRASAVELEETRTSQASVKQERQTKPESSEEKSTGSASSPPLRASAVEFIPTVNSFLAGADDGIHRTCTGGGVLQRPPPYDGCSYREAYRAQFEMLSQLNHWTETEKATLLAVSLRGAALTVLSNLTSERRGDYRALVIAMEKPTRFTPTGPGDCT